MNDEVLSEEELKRAVQRLFKLSQIDPEFRALCVKNPNEALRQIAGKSVPPNITIQFLDSPADGAVAPTIRRTDAT